MSMMTTSAKRILPGCLVRVIFGLSLTVESFAQSGTWTTKAPMPTPRCCSAVGAAEGVLYAIGGSQQPYFVDSVEAYDPATDRWTRKSRIPRSCSGAGAGVIAGVIYVVGCPDSSSQPSAVYAYETKDDTWTLRAPLPTPRWGPAVAAVNGVLYAIGGEQNVGAHSGRVLNAVEAYDPRTDTWTSRAAIPTPRWLMAAAATGGRIYVIGGVSDVNSATVSAANEAYDPTTNTWSARAPIPTPRFGATAGVVAGQIYVVGGQLNGDPRSVQPISQAYDPVIDSWTTSTPAQYALVVSSAGVVDDLLYVVGGQDAPSGLPVNTNQAFSPFLAVAIDIKPGDPRNTINLKSAGTVPVAILGSATFDPMTVDPATVTLAGAAVATRGRGQPMTAVADVNRDGYLDLLLHFRTQDLKLTPTSAEAVLYGETFSGQRLRGADPVRIVSFLSPRAPIGNPNPGKRNSRLGRPRL